MVKLTGRDLKDFTLTMRDLAPLPWRQISVDQAGNPHQFRASGNVSGFHMVVLQTIMYFPPDHATKPGLIEKVSYLLTGPDVDDLDHSTSRTLEYVFVYDDTNNLIGQDVNLDGVPVEYVI